MRDKRARAASQPTCIGAGGKRVCSPSCLCLASLDSNHIRPLSTRSGPGPEVPPKPVYPSRGRRAWDLFLQAGEPGTYSSRGGEPGTYSSGRKDPREPIPSGEEGASGTYSFRGRRTTRDLFLAGINQVTEVPSKSVVISRSLLQRLCRPTQASTRSLRRTTPKRYYHRSQPDRSASAQNLTW